MATLPLHGKSGFLLPARAHTVTSPSLPQATLPPSPDALYWQHAMLLEPPATLYVTRAAAAQAGAYTHMCAWYYALVSTALHSCSFLKCAAACDLRYGLVARHVG